MRLANPADYFRPAWKPRVANPVAPPGQIVYRGTQLATVTGKLRSTSWTDSLPVAIIWAAVPGDVFSSSHAARHAHFVPTSTVHEARVTAPDAKVLKMGDYTSLTIGYLNRLLPSPMPDDEIRKIYNYLHNRLIGKVSGGEFEYQWTDDEGNPVDEDILPFSLTQHFTLISEARDEWEYDKQSADRFEVDAYALADSPAVQRAALAAGYEALSYRDVFQGGEWASKRLFNEEVDNLDGVEMERDIKSELVPTHWTYRPLVPSAIEIVRSLPAEEALHASGLVQPR
jgi:hypothetical protein